MGAPGKTPGQAPGEGRRLPAPLIGAGLIAAALVLVLLGGLVVDRWPFGFDRAILTSLRHWGGPPWLAGAAINVTALGSGTVLTIVVLAVAGLLLVQRLPLTAAATIAACWSGGRIVDLAKTYFARARPDIVDHLVPVTHASFPSGHAASSAVCYLTLAALASQVTRDRATRRYVAIVAILLVGAIGTSRVYLGVHWPSDVLAGWCFGTLWALGWWFATARARASLGGERQHALLDGER
ncbi:phosphatase PAP2 family protein [Sphingomonas sp.]|jgi:undecaprenyl-diphosphatase|uniref:phosphatase PAP2 family protein n=1 Tax=Sphingomonas sp. TaxID=28214 RepID=UPI002ED9BC75